MVDNQSALKVLKNSEHHGHMKHINIKWHWICDVIKHGEIEAHFLSTREMIADIFTKALPHVTIEQYQLSLGLE